MCLAPGLCRLPGAARRRCTTEESERLDSTPVSPGIRERHDVSLMSAEPPTPAVLMPSAAEIYELIAQAAYYRAEKRGFTPGLEADDWLQAETEVMERLRARHTAGGA
jgi:hypothetical protein